MKRPIWSAPTRVIRALTSVPAGQADCGVGRAAADIFGERAHVLKPAVRLAGRRGRRLTGQWQRGPAISSKSSRRPLSAPLQRLFQTSEISQQTFHFLRIGLSLCSRLRTQSRSRLPGPGTSMRRASESFEPRNRGPEERYRPALAIGLTRLSLIDRILAPVARGDLDQFDRLRRIGMEADGDQQVLVGRSYWPAAGQGRRRRR